MLQDDWKVNTTWTCYPSMLWVIIKMLGKFENKWKSNV